MSSCCPTTNMTDLTRIKRTLGLKSGAEARSPHGTVLHVEVPGPTKVDGGCYHCLVDHKIKLLGN